MFEEIISNLKMYFKNNFNPNNNNIKKSDMLSQETTQLLPSKVSHNKILYY